MNVHMKKSYDGDWSFDAVKFKLFTTTNLDKTLISCNIKVLTKHCKYNFFDSFKIKLSLNEMQIKKLIK
jgi:hypothetical protein